MASSRQRASDRQQYMREYHAARGRIGNGGGYTPAQWIKRNTFAARDYSQGGRRVNMYPERCIGKDSREELKKIWPI